MAIIACGLDLWKGIWLWETKIGHPVGLQIAEC